MLDPLFSLAPWAALPLLLAGFYPLIKGADWLVEGGSTLAKRLNVPTLVIGLTVVAFGTSMPELVVNLFASTNGSAGLALGNVLGSNLFNILVILGVSAFIYPMKVQKSSWLVEMPVLVLIGIMLLVMANDRSIDGAATDILTRSDGLFLVGLFALFMGYVAYLAITGEMDPGLELKGWSIPVSLVFVILGMLMLGAGGKVIVDSAVFLARNAGWSERLIGLTIVSVGTSLPELATSAVAAMKKNADIAVGNILGSNIFNVLFVLAISASITPLPLAAGVQLDLWMNLGVSVLLLGSVVFRGSRHLSRRHGIMYIGVYLAYLAWLLVGPAA